MPRSFGEPGEEERRRWAGTRRGVVGVGCPSRASRSGETEREAESRGSESRWRVRARGVPVGKINKDGRRNSFSGLEVEPSAFRSSQPATLRKFWGEISFDRIILGYVKKRV